MRVTQGIVSFQVQMFYAWRIWKLVGNKFLVALVAVTATVGGRKRLCYSCIPYPLTLVLLVSGIGTAIAIGMRPEFFGFIHLKVHRFRTAQSLRDPVADSRFSKSSSCGCWERASVTSSLPRPSPGTW